MSDLQSKVNKPNRYAVYDPRSNTIRCYRDGKLMVTISSEAVSELGECKKYALERWVEYGGVIV